MGEDWSKITDKQVKNMADRKQNQNKYEGTENVKSYKDASTEELNAELERRRNG